MKAINKLEWKHEEHYNVKEGTYWEKQRHMNLYHEKQLFLYDFIHNTGIKYYLQWRASALECFPIQPTPLLPLLGVYLYNSNVETTNLKIVTGHYHVLIA